MANDLQEEGGTMVIISLLRPKWGASQVVEQSR